MKEVVISKKNIIRRWNIFVNKVSPMGMDPNRSEDTCSFFWATITKTLVTLAIYLFGYMLTTGVGHSVLHELFKEEISVTGLWYYWIIGLSVLVAIVTAAGLLVAFIIGILMLFGKASDVVGTSEVIKHVKERTCARIRFEE